MRNSINTYLREDANAYMRKNSQCPSASQEKNIEFRDTGGRKAKVEKGSGGIAFKTTVSVSLFSASLRLPH